MWFAIQIIITSLVYLAGIFWIRWKTKKRYEEWDINTTTISDYTVRYEIPYQVYHSFISRRIEDHELGSNRSDVSAQFEKESTIYAFKKYLKRKVEQRLKDIPYELEDDDSLIQVSEINFVTENTHVVKLLVKRGDALDVKNEQKAQRIEKQIKDYLRKSWKKASIPKEAYVTFKTEEAYLRAINVDATNMCGFTLAKEQWEGHPFVLEQVQEPSNICWENRHTNKCLKIIKQIIVVFLLLLILVAFIAVLFYSQKVASKLRREYPEVD